MTETLPSNDPGEQKRRSTRIVQAVPITVTGVDALGQPFKERTTTSMVNCHGCKYHSKHYVPKNSAVKLEIPRMEAGQPARVVQGRVVWVQRPRTVRELFQIGLEFEVPGNVWGVAFPPEDWFACPGEEAAAAPQIAPPSTTTQAKPATEAKPAEAATAPTTESKIHVVPTPAHPEDAQLASARQLSRMIADAKESLDKTLRRDAQTAINDEMTIVRQQLDAQLHEAVERAIKVSMERVSESAVRKVVHEAAERTSAIVEDARKASDASAQQVDEKLRQAVQQAVSQAAEQAAREAAQQTTAQNLKQAVEEAVERAVAGRDALAPSLEVLASPEAAQQQIANWKKSLEEAAQGVRGSAIEQTHAEAEAASRRWKEEFEAALAGASQKVSEKLNEASQAAVTQTEVEVSARSAELRATFEEERARSEQSKAQLREAAASALEQTRRRMDEMFSTEFAEIGRKADEIIRERTHHIEPILRDSAQEVISHFNTELDKKLTPRLEDTQRALRELANAEQEATRIEATVREQVGRVSEQALQESLERLRQETAKVPAEMEQSCRDTLAKAQNELEQSSTEAQHVAYEAMVKASDWYQKKAQTTMQAALEKSVEQSAGALRDRAAEISRLAASELDHQRRAYVEHSQAQIEETAREVVARERENLGQTADAASTGFADRVQATTNESLGKFQEASRQALEKARSDLEYDRQASLAEFEKRLGEHIQLGVAQAQTQLQSQLTGLMKSWEERNEAQQQQWLELVKKSGNESIEQYKARLENASNSWLLASATTLGQHSQVVLDTLAKAAEKRLRDTVGEVLAGMGDKLKERMAGMSGEFSREDEEDLPSGKKK